MPPSTPIVASKEIYSVSGRWVPSSDSTFTRTGTGNDKGGPGSEDCLKVNIYTPSKAKAGSNCEFEPCILP